MPERQAAETLEPPSDPNRVNNDRALGWLSASILHDLRNPLGTICTGVELLMDLDSTSTQVKRLAAMPEVRPQIFLATKDGVARPSDMIKRLDLRLA